MLVYAYSQAIISFRRDIALSDARKRKLRKDLARLDQERRLFKKDKYDTKALELINFNVHNINEKLTDTLVDQTKLHEMDDRLRLVESSIETLNQKKHYVSELNTTVSGPEMEIGQVLLKF